MHVPRWMITVAAVTATFAAPTRGQLRLPGVPLPSAPLQRLQQSQSPVDAVSLQRLSNLRRLHVAALIRSNRGAIEADPQGEPAVRDEILALDPTASAREIARTMGFEALRENAMNGLGLHLVVLKPPPAMSTAGALQALRAADPGGVYEFNHIYTGGGVVSAVNAVTESVWPAAPNTPAGRVRIGLLDSGVAAAHPVFQHAVIHPWGCDRGPVPDAHGTAVASLLVGQAEGFHGVRPEAELFSADVYCGRPTGGAVDLLAAAFEWMVAQEVAVINVSLVGPDNATLARIVSAVIAHGHLIVAAVGNDGPAAPPLYPAAYPHVVGVTAVDSHRRVLIEAARGSQVTFAAPGADMVAAAPEGKYCAVRGTSFAAPIVAALLSQDLPVPDAARAAAAVDALARKAIDLGPVGRDLTYGFGLVGAEYFSSAGRNRCGRSYQE